MQLYISFIGVDWLLKAYKVHRYKDHVINVNELNFVGLNLRNRNTIQVILTLLN